MRPVVVVAETAARRRSLARALEAADPALDVWPADPTTVARADGEALFVVSGAALARAIARAAGPSARLLVMDDEAASVEALQGLPATAWGVIPTRATAEEIRGALAAVDAGFLVLPPAARSTVRPAGWAGAPPIDDAVDRARGPYRADGGSAAEAHDELVAQESLTPREREVLDLLVQGLSNRRIAVVLGISEHTVKFHVASIYGKLGARSRAHLVRRALRRGLITL